MLNNTLSASSTLHNHIKKVPLVFEVVSLNHDTGAPTTIYKKESQQLGLTRKGQKELEQIMLSKDYRKRRFRDTFYNKSAMLENEWHFERYDIETNETVSIIKTITNNALDLKSFSRHAKSFTMSEIVVSYEVQCLECDFGNYVIEMDEVTFPKGDPHFTCTIIYKNESKFTDTDCCGISKCSQNSNYPVRSQLAEYFYRHDRIFYDELMNAKVIAEHGYHISLTLKQIEEVNKRSDVEDIMAMVSGTYNQDIPESESDLDSMVIQDDDTDDDEV
ncbi:predicted protein [Naegleria gruberi]|uniref:Predicted protein n=1 Tax=Naegleria gruberi TaxID=5762 RepID=D2V673_NAEGR|nr:uncharacterized protein NAEGRDRAFT_64333 [Naegleria gruberi]EFC47783.1 predicted protein [Naegleria gruberi]|eukprot:XP_002680527.1 predicted protein [Naegleria gruberi strain NEG-M]